MPNDPYIAASARAENRAKAEHRLLLAIAPIGRWGLALAKRAGITAADFTSEDLYTIFRALEIVHAKEGVSFEVRNLCAMKLARHGLAEAGNWNDDDHREQGTGMVWGPERLVHLFTAVGPLEAEKMIGPLAEKLKEQRRC